MCQFALLFTVLSVALCSYGFGKIGKQSEIKVESCPFTNCDDNSPHPPSFIPWPLFAGGQPKSLDSLKPSEKSPCLSTRVHLFRNIAQYQQLSSELDESAKVLVIGGGFVGSELAYAMTRTGMSHHLINNSLCSPQLSTLWFLREKIYWTPAFSITCISPSSNCFITYLCDQERRCSSRSLRVATWAEFYRNICPTGRASSWRQPESTSDLKLKLSALSARRTARGKGCFCVCCWKTYRILRFRYFN